MPDNDLYMACIDLKGKRCLVIGGGPIALEKIQGLLASKATVSVVALEAIDEIHDLAASDSIRFEEAPYRADHLDGCFLVIAATSDTSVNTQVHADAEERSMLVNVADVPDLCNFILPAIVRRGPIAIAISTRGASPALAKRIRREAAESFGAPYAELAGILEELRPWAKENLPTYQDRKRFFEDIVNGAPDPVDLLASGCSDEVRALIEQKKSQQI
ncbi:MAG: bifunctional precorrin-2 dehydrogenase/sirohydrochlorin ferrochelatase [Actinobacteria bacterium]|nr:bifunctional precorrin-2 dehydrogenase/sirohydrochlorin ferrochelatase [Actinomycetota bacterium]